ncbi:hypothetical protein PInf_024122 [Phytophthora infestans]|nr:hypothetical protein PInf_024122 [Phytophthora infestans]
MKKTREDEVKKGKEQAATDRAKKDAETKQKLDEIRHERDVLKKTLHQILDQNSNQLAKHIKGSAVQTNTQANLSGSSESQDSIDAAHPRSDRRNSQLSNEQSEISPSDVPLTVDAADEETKGGDVAQERPPLFTIFEARSSTADSSSSESKPATLSKPQVFRTQGVSSTESNESKTQEGAGDDETKGSH